MRAGRMPDLIVHASHKHQRTVAGASADVAGAVHAAEVGDMVAGLKRLGAALATYNAGVVGGLARLDDGAPPRAGI